jgi:hypothetical protein
VSFWYGVAARLLVVLVFASLACACSGAVNELPPGSPDSGVSDGRTAESGAGDDRSLPADAGDAARDSASEGAPPHDGSVDGKSDSAAADLPCEPNDCIVGSEVCCWHMAATTEACTTPTGCTGGGESFPCGNAENCIELGHPATVCCATTGVNADVVCRDPTECTATVGREILCNPHNTTSCPAGQMCKASATLPNGFYACQ